MAHVETTQLDIEVQPDSDEVKLRALPWSLSGGMLNTIFALWTFNGSVFLLFLDELGLPKEHIGLLLSLFPFCGLLALGFAPAAARLGRKRVFLACYGIRKVVMAGLLLLPWIIAACGRTMGLAYMVAVISIFAVLRALAETAYYPWMQEFVPDHVRGKYSGISAVLGTIVSTLAMLLAGWVVGPDADLPRFLQLIGAGAIFGILGVAAMAWVPGGKPLRVESSAMHTTNMAEALRDRNLLAYLAGLGAVTMGGLFLTSFLPLFVKGQLGVPDGAVFKLDAAVMIGSGLSSLICGWAADRVGSRPVLMPTIAIGLLIPLGWLLLPRGGAHILTWCILLYGAYGIVNGSILVTTLRLLFNGVVPQQKSTAYTAIYYAWFGLTSGLAPLLAGRILAGRWHEYFGVLAKDAYSLLFLLCFLLLIVGGVLFYFVAPDDRYTTRMLLQRLLYRKPLPENGS